MMETGKKITKTKTKNGQDYLLKMTETDKNFGGDLRKQSNLLNNGEDWRVVIKITNTIVKTAETDGQDC